MTLADGKNKILNTNRTFQLLDVINDLKTFTIKDKKIIEYFPSSIINSVSNPIFNEMVNKKKDDMSK
jgi:hypothetical protein